MKTPIPSSRFLVVLFAIPALASCGRDDEAAKLPDEKKVAMERLVESQTGPKYFRAQEGDSTPDEQGEIWIEVAAAREQVERIVRERKGDEVMKKRIYQLIDEAAQPHPSRAVGGERASLAKLNVALDAHP